MKIENERLLLHAHVIVKTSNLVISHRHYAEYQKRCAQICAAQLQHDFLCSFNQIE